MNRISNSIKMGVGLLCALAITHSNTNNSAQAAETAVLRIGPLEQSITVTELESIAETGKASESYEFYTKRLSPAQRSQIVAALRTKFPVNFLYMDKLLNSNVGSTILKDLSIVTAREDNAGMQALRAGIIKGSIAPGGLSIISFIKAYPSDRITVDLKLAFKVVGNLNTSFRQTQQFMTAIASKLDSKPTQLNLPFDPTQPGSAPVQVPLLMLASSADKSTPALTEQIIGFNKIPRDKWLVGIVGATHASVKDPSTTQDEATKPSTAFAGDEVFGEQAVDIRRYIKATTLAFAAQMTTEADKYAIFLTPEYAQYASTKAFPIHLVREIPDDAMTVVKQFVNKGSLN